MRSNESTNDKCLTLCKWKDVLLRVDLILISKPLCKLLNLQRCCKKVMDTCEVFCTNNGLTTVKVQGIIVDLYIKYKLKQPREWAHQTARIC
jgi:hypothetical protein